MAFNSLGSVVNKYLRQTIYCLFYPCLFVSVLKAQDEFEQHLFKYKEGLLPYQLLQPRNIDSTKKYPLILYLHGAGSRGVDNKIPNTHIQSLLLADSNRTQYPCFVLVPQCPKAYRWVETDWTLLSHLQPKEPSIPMALVIELLKEFENHSAIDTNRIYVTGLSMGGFGVWDLIARFPDKFAAAVPICGGADLQTVQLLTTIPIWCFHGAADRVVRPSRSREMVAALKKYNADIKYTEYNGVGHGSWKPAYAEPDLLYWLFSKLKD